ncbi:MAG TPA: cytochrome P460 family protein [Terracidiphilus sp.]|nr:cytochrome P460 family protein [Terracidiphilus sp.]
MRKAGIVPLAVVLCLVAALCVVAAAALAPKAPSPGSTHSASANLPSYAANGDLLPPAHYREWIFLTSGFNMSYTAKPAGMPMFDNVFVNPAAYRAFLRTGTWPDKTMLVLEVREAKSKASINRRGNFQSPAVTDLEVHVKDEARFPGKWAFFSFDSPASNGTLIPSGAPCYSCHAAHGAVDTTFVQFYPTLLPVALKKGTLSAELLEEMRNARK